MAGALLVAQYLQVGLVCVWTPSPQCRCNFSALCEQPLVQFFPGVQFIEVLTPAEYEAKGISSKALRPHISTFSLIGPVSVALKTIMDHMDSLAGCTTLRRHPNVTELMDAFLNFNEDIVETAIAHLNTIRRRSGMADPEIVGVHWRRGDLVPLMTKATGQRWNEQSADRLISEAINEEFRKSKNVVILIATDDDLVYNDVMITNKYSFPLSRIFFGPAHGVQGFASASQTDDFAPGDRHAKIPTIRKTSVKDFVVEVCALKMCRRLILTGESTVKTIISSDWSSRPPSSSVGYTPNMHSKVDLPAWKSLKNVVNKNKHLLSRTLPIVPPWMDLCPAQEQILRDLSLHCVMNRRASILEKMVSKSAWNLKGCECGHQIGDDTREYDCAKAKWIEVEQSLQCRPRHARFQASVIWGPMRLAVQPYGLPTVFTFLDHVFLLRANTPWAFLKQLFSECQSGSIQTETQLVSALSEYRAVAQTARMSDEMLSAFDVVSTTCEKGAMVDPEAEVREAIASGSPYWHEIIVDRNRRPPLPAAPTLPPWRRPPPAEMTVSEVAKPSRVVRGSVGKRKHEES